MKKFISLLLCLALCANVLVAAPKNKEKKEEGFVFTTVKENPITPVKNQHRSSTCWSFSAMAFFESEVLRMQNKTVDLSEMFLVHKSMIDRGELYVRLHGNATFAPGGWVSDALYCLENYGLVPQDAMPGIRYGEELPVHNELDAVAGAYIKAIAKGNFSKLTPVWKEGFIKIYDTYLGECPTEFVVDGVKTTPMEYAKSLGLDAKNYVSITSFTHHPFYTPIVIEVEDNWRHATAVNLPMDEMMQVLDNAIMNGYTVAWGADVSETGFTRNGIGVMPDADRGAELTGSDMARWTGMSAVDKKAELTSRPLPEIEVTQEMRQQAFDNWQTTDDHGMLIYGIAKDQNGKKYYMVKNSWGTNSKYEGIWYVSETFVKYKTINFVLHKDAIPAAINAKLK